jgi:hypothetical protein
MEVHNISSISFRNQTVSVNNIEKHKSHARFNYQTFDKKVEKIIRVRVEMRKYSLMKEIYYGLSKPTPEWAVYGICLTNSIFILTIVLLSVFNVVPCSDIGNFINLSGAGLNSYLTLYFGSRTK